MHEWSFEEGEQLRQEALEVSKKKDLHWDEDLANRIDAMIESIEKENEAVDRDINMMTAIQVDEVRQSMKMLDETQPEADRLVKTFDDLGQLVAAEREDMKDFQQLKEVHITLETLSAVTNTVDILLSLQHRHFEYEEALTAPHTPSCITSICADLWPIHEFKANLRSGQGEFSSHFSLLESSLNSVIKKLRTIFIGFAEAGCEINRLDNDGGDWGKLLDEQFALLTDAMSIVHSEKSPMFADISGFDDMERKCMKAGGLWALCLYWIEQGTHKLYSDIVTRKEGEMKLVESLGAKQVLDRLTEWIKAVDGIIFNLVKDGHPEPTAQSLSQGPWKDMHHAEQIVERLVTVGHANVLRVLNAWSAGLTSKTLSLGAPDLLQIVKWSKFYDTAKGILRWYEGFSISPYVLTTKGKQELEEKRAFMMRSMSETLKGWLSDMGLRQAETILKDAYSTDRGIERLNGRFCTMGPVDFFELLNTQYDEISSFKDTAALEFLATAVQNATLQYMTAMKEGCTGAYWRGLVEEGVIQEDESKDKRLIVLLALLNDMGRFQAQLPKIEGKFSTVVQPSKLHFDIAMTEVIGVQEAVVQELAQFVVCEECMELWDALFESPDDPFDNVLATIEDYQNDMKAGLEPENYEKSVDAMYKVTETEYIKRFAEYCKDDKKKKLKGSRFEAMTAEFNLLNETFGRWGVATENSTAIKILADVGRALSTLVWRSYEKHLETLVRTYPDVPTELIKFLIKKIDGFSGSDKDRANDSWDMLVKSQNRDDDDVPQSILTGAAAPTIFANIKFDTAVAHGVIGAFLGKLGGGKAKKRKSIQPEPQAPPKPQQKPSPAKQQQPVPQEEVNVNVGSLDDFLNS